MSPFEAAHHVISLARTPDRLQQFKHHNAHLGSINVLSAFDGTAIDWDRSDIRALVREDCYYNRPAIGCALSHLALWEKAITTGNMVTIFEDDAIIHTRFNEQSRLLLEGVGQDWDIILWGYNISSIVAATAVEGLPTAKITFQHDEPKDFEAYQVAAIKPILMRLTRAYGSCGYSVSPKGAHALRAACFPLQKRLCDIPELGKTLPEYGIDMAMATCYPALQAYATFPPLLIATSEFGNSTIQGDA